MGSFSFNLPFSSGPLYETASLFCFGSMTEQRVSIMKRRHLVQSCPLFNPDYPASFVRSTCSNCVAILLRRRNKSVKKAKWLHRKQSEFYREIARKLHHHQIQPARNREHKEKRKRLEAPVKFVSIIHLKHGSAYRTNDLTSGERAENDRKWTNCKAGM